MNCEYNFQSTFSTAHDQKKQKTLKKRIIPTVLVIEVLHHNDPRTRAFDSDTARALEMEYLVRRGTLEIILEEDVLKDSKMISASFAVTFKDFEIQE